MSDLLSPAPFGRLLTAMVTPFDDEGRVLKAEFDSIDIFSCYFPSGSSGDIRQEFKMRFLDNFYSFIQNQGFDPPWKKRPEASILAPFWRPWGAAGTQSEPKDRKKGDLGATLKKT